MTDSAAVVRAYCTTREAAEMLDVSLRTVQLWTEAGVLEARRTPGGHRRILRTSVEALLHKDPPAAPAADPRPEGLHVLLVEDDEAVCRLCERVISRWPIPVVLGTARDGFEALVKIGLGRPDLLITDLNMPAMDGFTMLRQLKNMSAVADMAIIVITGLDAATIAERGGVPDGIPVLPKPIPFERIQDIATVVDDRRRRAARGQ